MKKDELSCYESLKMEFTKLKLDEFGMKIENKHLSSSRKVLLFLILFTTTHLCVVGYSSMVVVKNKYT